jgi:hypothetical protein
MQADRPGTRCPPTRRTGHAIGSGVAVAVAVNDHDHDHDHDHAHAETTLMAAGVLGAVEAVLDGLDDR